MVLRHRPSFYMNQLMFLRTLPLSLLCGLILISCSSGKPRVTAENVLIEEKPIDLQVEAQLQPSEQVEIKFPFPLEIEEVSVKLGQQVQKGQKLLGLSEPFFSLGQEKLRNKLLEKEELLSKKTYFLQNRNRLLDEGKIDQTLFETIESETKGLGAEIEQLRADISLKAHMIEHATVHSPIAGIVTENNISSGTATDPNQHLLTITQTNPLLVRFELLPEDHQTVSDRMPITVTVEGFNHDSYEAEVFYIAPMLHPERHTFEVKARLYNLKTILKAGLNAKVRFTSSEIKQTFLLRAEAVVEKEGKFFVYIVSENKAWERSVRIRQLPESPHLVEVLDGISPTDLVINNNLDKLSNGMEVKLWR